MNSIAVRGFSQVRPKVSCRSTASEGPEMVQTTLEVDLRSEWASPEEEFTGQIRPGSATSTEMRQIRSMPLREAKKLAFNAVWNDIPLVRTIMCCAREKCSGSALGAMMLRLLREDHMSVGLEYISEELSFKCKGVQGKEYI